MRPDRPFFSQADVQSKAALTVAAQAAAAAVDSEAVVELVRTATQIPSITPNEKEFANWVGEQLSDICWNNVSLFECAPDRPNVYATTGQGSVGLGSGQSLLLVGHLDTVAVDDWLIHWENDSRANPFGAHIIDGEIWGRGVADQKAGICIIIEAVRAVRRAGFEISGELAALFVCDEESGQPNSGVSQGMKAAVSEIWADSNSETRPSFAIYTELTTSAIYTAQMGFLIADITLHGKSAYFGKPELGVDALAAGHKLLARLWQHSEELSQVPSHDLLGEAFLLVTSVSSGGNIAVPGRFDLSLIRKLLPSENLDEAAASIKQIAHMTASDTGTTAEVVFSAPRNHQFGGTPDEIETSHPGVLALADSIVAVTGQKARIEGAPYWSEKPFLASLGIPGVYFAPGDISDCHTPFERLSIEELILATKTLAHFISSWCPLQQIPKGT